MLLSKKKQHTQINSVYLSGSNTFNFAKYLSINVAISLLFPEELSNENYGVVDILSNQESQSRDRMFYSFGDLSFSS